MPSFTTEKGIIWKAASEKTGEPVSDTGPCRRPGHLRVENLLEMQGRWERQGMGGSSVVPAGVAGFQASPWEAVQKAAASA